MIKWVQFFGGLPPLEYRGQKPSTILCDFEQVHTSIANISGTDEDIDKRKTALSPALPPTYGEKIGEVWSTKKKVVGGRVDPPKVKFFERLYFGP